MKILISRTDSIGDVMLTLPMIGIIKTMFPDSYIGFVGKNYTKPVISCCQHVDVFIDKEDMLSNKLNKDLQKFDTIIHVFPDKQIAAKAKKLNIKNRIGTTNRWYHWLFCNQLIKLSRKNSSLHEAELNTKLLRPLGIDPNYNKEQLHLYYGFKPTHEITSIKSFFDNQKNFRLILHPKSQGSAREWGLNNFIELIKLLKHLPIQIFISGTSKEREQLSDLFEEVGNLVHDITGQFSLNEFIYFISQCDALIANSTGPLHIAAALQKHAIGIYPPMRPIHPGRWSPIGENATYFVLNKNCTDCKNDSYSCACIQAIRTKEIADYIEKILVESSTKN